MDEINELREKVKKFLDEGFYVSSFFTFGRNVNELRSNWKAGVRRDGKFLVVSFDGVAEDVPTGDSRADMKLLDMDIYGIVNDLSKKVDFDIKKIYVSVSDKIVVSFFSNGLTVKKFTINDKDIKEEDVALFRR